MEGLKIDWEQMDTTFFIFRFSKLSYMKSYCLVRWHPVMLLFLFAICFKHNYYHCNCMFFVLTNIECWITWWKCFKRSCLPFAFCFLLFASCFWLVCMLCYIHVANRKWIQISWEVQIEYNYRKHTEKYWKILWMLGERVGDRFTLCR